MTTHLVSGSSEADVTLLLAPGAGAPATSPWMEQTAGLLADAGVRIVRFDFGYMRARAETGSRRPPPKAEALVGEYEAAVADVLGTMRGAARSGQRLLIGGKSLGGRVASLLADRAFARGDVSGLICLGYPFHPPNQPDKLRTAHLRTLACPALIVQGERDPFGGPEEVAGYALSASIGLHWAKDGDHDLAPRRSSGATLAGNLAEAVAAIVRFAQAR